MSETTELQLRERAAAAQVSRELTVINQGNAAVPMPANFEQMTKFASLMAQGGSMVGAAFRDNPGACLGALIQAMRWGMDPYACSQKMYIASKSGEGPIAYEAQLVHAVLLKNAPLSKRPRIDFEGEGDNRVCVVTFHVIGDDDPITYRSPPISKVRKPRDKGSPLWYDNPDQQLAYYTIRAAARLHFPDVIMGVYTPDEVDQITEESSREAKFITLSGASTDNIPDADFSDGTAVLAKNAKKRKPKEEPEPAKAEAEPPPPAPPQPEAAKAEEKDDFPSDEEIVASVEAEHRAAVRGTKADVIRRHRAVLERIREMSDGELFDRADKLLNLYELD